MLVLIWVGMSGLAFLRRALEEALEIADDEPLVATLRDLLHLVPGLHREEEALAVGLQQGRLGADGHADGGGGEMLHLDHGPHAAATGREMALEGGARGVPEKGDDERRGEDVDAPVAEG